MAAKNPFAADKSYHLKIYRVLFEGSPSMLRDLVEVELPAVTEKPWNAGDLWKEWYLENKVQIDKFDYITKIRTVDFRGNEVPDLSEADVTFLKFALKKIVTDFNPIQQLAKKRNEFAHMNFKEMSLLDFISIYGDLVDICRNLFKKYRDLRETWEGYLTNVVLEDVVDKDQLEKICEEQMKLFTSDLESFVSRWKLPGVDKGSKVRSTNPSSESKLGRQFSSLEQVSSLFKNEMRETCKHFFVPGTMLELDITIDYIDVGFEKKAARVKATPLAMINDPTSTGPPKVAAEAPLLPSVPQVATIEFDIDVEYEEKDDDPPRQKLRNPVKQDYFFKDVISEIEESKINRFVIEANGGFGKSVLAKNIVHKWANDDCLTMFTMVFHLEMKTMNLEDSLEANLIDQYHCLGKYNDIQSSLIKNASKILWIIDGLDDCSSRAAAREFLRKNISAASDFGSSYFLFLTRPLGRDLLKGILANVTEFTIAPLGEKQKVDFVKSFPFSEEKVNKEESMVSKIESCSFVNNFTSVPLFLVMLCAIFDDKNRGNDLKMLLDILALTLKHEQGRLHRENDKIYSTATIPFITENIRIFATLGKILLTSEFEISDIELTDQLEKTLTPEEAAVTRRLEILHHTRVARGTRTQSSFYVFDEKLEELLVGIFLVRNSAPIPIQSLRNKLGQKQIDILRCASTLYLNDIFCLKDFTPAFDKYIEFAFDSSQSFTSWRCWQVIGQVLKIGREKLTFEPMAHKVTDYVKVKAESRFYTEDFRFLQQNLKHFFRCLRSHSIERVCNKCLLPEELLKKITELGFENKVLDIQTWPFNEILYVSRIFYISTEFMLLCLPVDGDSEKGHAGESCIQIIARAAVTLPNGVQPPPPTSALPDPLPVQLIEAPPIFAADHATANRFPIGVGFVSVLFKGKIYILGGGQKQPDEDFSYLPIDVFVMNPDDETWNRIKPTGDVPPPTFSSVGVATKVSVFLFGGSANGKVTNEIFTFDSNGKFAKLVPVGAVPSPRREHRGWEYKGILHFFGGFGPTINSSTKGYLQGGDFVEWEGEAGMSATNQLIQFDPTINAFSLPSTTGTPPSPRINFGVARLREKLFLHGGLCHGRSLKDFFLLNLDTLAWSELDDFGLTRPTSNHTLTPISASEILVVGGSSPGGISNEVKIFDAQNSSWKEEPNLTSEFCGGGGLMMHGAVAVKKRNRVVRVFCFGGYVDEDRKSHPRHIVKFDLEE